MADRGAKKWTDDEKASYILISFLNNLYPLCYYPPSNPLDSITKFLVQAVKQMQAGGGKINYKQLDVEGRTPKALVHLWDKLSKDTAYSNQGGDTDGAGDSAEPGTEPSTPAPKRGSATPGSRKRTAQTAAIGEGDDAGSAPATPSGPKRQRKAPTAKARAKAAAIIQAVDEDEPEETKPDLKMEEQQNGLADEEI
ncbi:hypothetical protein CHU98_g5066 [Xylaria longipes]|nr:hypothetical protein CHU98_g5066 [Xylaria longipes]